MNERSILDPSRIAESQKPKRFRPRHYALLTFRMRLFLELFCSSKLLWHSIHRHHFPTQKRELYLRNNTLLSSSKLGFRRNNFVQILLLRFKMLQLWLFKKSRNNYRFFKEGTRKFLLKFY